MTRDDGWRFLSLGRHLERLHVRRDHARATSAPSRPPADPALLEWLLELSDSLLTYRARYMQQPGVAGGRRPAAVRRAQPALGACSSSAKLAKHVPAAARTRGAGDVLADVDRCSSACCRADDRAPGRAVRRTAASIETLLRRLPSSWRCALSDALTLRYFSHVDELPHATVGRD